MVVEVVVEAVEEGVEIGWRVVAVEVVVGCSFEKQIIL